MRLSVLTALCATFAGVSAHDHWGHFQMFVKDYDRYYDSHEEFMGRWKTFARNMETIAAHEGPYRMAVNKFSDRDPSELTTHIGRTYLYSTPLLGGTKCSSMDYTPADVPNTVDWVSSGGVTPVKDQGQCGSCWSFSATGALEGAWFVRTNDLVNLSEQELLDCSRSYGNMGCNGGLMDGAFEFVIDNGLCSEATVPYDASVHRLGCEQDTCTSIVNMTDCYDLTPDNEMLLMQAVSQQPVSVAIGANAVGFMSYSGGILSPDGCNTDLDHGVLVVGYGEDNGQKYWLVKNSWGTDWGEGGYVRIARTESTDSEGTCGVAMQPSFPVST